MGGVANMMEKLPGMGQMSPNDMNVDDKQFRRMEAIINSMTPQERRYPDVINGSRKRRIAAGSGTQVQDVNRLLKQHKNTQRMMKKVMRKGGMERMMRGVQAAQQGARKPGRARRR